ncbi:hypothetical protein GCM10009761_27620 [Agromyces terreus]
MCVERRPAGGGRRACRGIRISSAVVASTRFPLRIQDGLGVSAAGMRESGPRHVREPELAEAQQGRGGAGWGRVGRADERMPQAPQPAASVPPLAPTYPLVDPARSPRTK